MKPDFPNLSRLARGTDQKDLADLETLFRKIRFEIDDHLSAIPVRPGDPSDEQEIVHSAASPLPIGLGVIPELQNGLGALEFRRRAHQRPHRGRRPALAADHAAQVTLRHEQLHERLSAVRPFRHANGVGTVGQRAGHDLDDVAGAAHDAGCSAATATGSGIRDTSVRTVSDGRAPVFSQ